jgi:hypothetical protein
MKIVVLLAVLVLASLALAQEEQEFVTETSCSLSLKTTVYPVDSSDTYGKVGIEGFLLDNKGNPLADQQIRISSTTGAFSCMPPVQFGDADVSSSVEGCLRTQEDGTFKIYLVKIPFNRPGVVKAFCTYGNFKINATGAYSITKWTKSTAKKKRDWKPKKRIPMSGEL